MEKLNFSLIGLALLIGASAQAHYVECFSGPSLKPNEAVHLQLNFDTNYFEFNYMLVNPDSDLLFGGKLNKRPEPEPTRIYDLKGQNLETSEPFEAVVRQDSIDRNIYHLVGFATKAIDLRCQEL